MTQTPLPGPYADPNLVVFGDRWFLYATSDGFPGWGSRSFSVLSSPDLVEWTDHGVILTLGEDVSWASEHAWAPTVVERDGRYFFYFTAESTIGVAVADHPSGPFTDLGHVLIDEGDFAGGMIDPAVFVDEGRHYLAWGNMWAHVVELGDDLVSFERDAVVSTQLPGFREALWIHRRGDVYYASWSENDTREEDYCVRYATGLSVIGPWTDRGYLVTKDVDRDILATGHHSICRVPGTDDWVIAYHRFAIPDGNGHTRETVFAPLHHTADGLLAPVEHPQTPYARPLR